jgi:hypothetical protein
MTTEKYSHCTHEDNTEPSRYFIIDYGTMSMQDTNDISSNTTSAMRKEELRLAQELAQELAQQLSDEIKQNNKRIGRTPPTMQMIVRECRVVREKNFKASKHSKQYRQS